MRNLLSLGVLCFLLMALAYGQEPGTRMAGKAKAKTEAGSSAGSVDETITKHEQDFAQAILKSGAAAIDQYEAEDIMSTDPSGRVTDKAQDKKDLSSGDVKLESLELSDIKVRSFGNTAVATGTSTIKGTFKGQDIGGAYRFTDTWVKRNGKWQLAASQSTKIQQ